MKSTNRLQSCCPPSCDQAHNCRNRKEKERKENTTPFGVNFNEKLNIIPGCPLLLHHTDSAHHLPNVEMRVYCPQTCQISSVGMTFRSADQEHLPNLEKRFYCHQAFMSSEFQCRDDVFELKLDVSGLKRA